MAKDYLWQRGRQWYLRLSIPTPIRPYFLSSTGKPMVRVVEPLGDSYEVAKAMAAQRVAVCTAVFTRLRAGEEMTPEQVKAALEPDPDPEPHDPFVYLRWLRSPEYHRSPEYQQKIRRFEAYGASHPASTEKPAGETVSQAAEAWFAEMTRDKSAAPRDTTIGGHRLRVRAFVDSVGDVPLTDVTRATASDFLRGLDVSNRTRNNYALTLKLVFKHAGRRGRFSAREEDNPFHDQRSKVAGSSRERFTVDELRKLFDSMPRDVAPKKHTPETALPWVALIALYTGARLEELAQLSTADVREAGANGATVTVIDVHNGGENKLKNESAARLIPVHSALVRAGLLDYVRGLPAGPLFPGLTRRASKGGKVGARVGELFRKKLVRLGLKRDGLCFHSFRHTVAGRLDAAEVRQSDAARVLGHAVAGMSYGTYSKEGPGLKQVAATVEKIAYEGLRLA
jgi:integrase